MSPLSDPPPRISPRAYFFPPPHPPPAFIGGIPLLDAAFAEFYGPQLDATNADSSCDAGINIADGPRDPRINAGDGREADGRDVESVAKKTRIDGKRKSPGVVLPKKTRAGVQSNNSGKSPKQGKKADLQSGTDGAAATTSDRNKSVTDHDTDGEHITAGRKNDVDAIKGCGDHLRGRVMSAPPEAA